MRVREVMSNEVIHCTPNTNLKEVARLMLENDCGDIPIVQDGDGRRPIGIITDRDITCRRGDGDHAPECTRMVAAWSIAMRTRRSRSISAWSHR